MPALRVCADPNNLPYSNRREEGFENRIADLVASELGMRVEYYWWPHRRGFIRQTLRAGECDVIIGVPASLDAVLTTRPYYRSTYAFVQRSDAPRHVVSLDDPQLRTLSVGVHLIGDDYSNTPPAHLLGRRGIVRNVRGYTVYGDYSLPSPTARLVEAVATGEVDVALAWGPIAGYFARRQPVPMMVTPIDPAEVPADHPVTFDIGIGVRRGDRELRDRLDAALRRRRADIDSVLVRYDVVPAPSPGQAAAR